MTDNNKIASLVCKHVAEDASAAMFLCSLPDVFAAACSERCLDESSEEELSMVHVRHIEKALCLPIPFTSLPVHFKMVREHDNWSIDYFDIEHTPEEGEFLAAPKGSNLRSIPDDLGVYVYVLPNKEPVMVTLDEGIICVPFWFDEDSSKTFARHLNGNEVLRKMPFSSVCEHARRSDCWFLGANFLKQDYDFAVLVRL